MTKNLFQDMVKAKNPQRTMPKREIPVDSYYERPQRKIPHVVGPRQSSSKYGLWFVAIFSILFLFFAMSFFFAKAQVLIDPKIIDLTLDENLSAVKDTNSDSLPFDLVILSGEETKKVAGGEEQDLSLKAKGKVFVYNTFNSTPQKLAANTSLEGSNGKIYKTMEATVVPGVDEEGLAGKVAVNIEASLPGDEFNSDPLDFKLPLFKGTSKYEKFYARSEGAIGGGFKGRSSVVSDADKEVAFGELKDILDKKLLQKAIDQIPPGFILYKDATFLNIDDESSSFVAIDGGIPLKIKGTLYGFLLNEKKLTQKIAKANITEYDDSDVYIPNIRDLQFSLVDKNVSFKDVQNINFKLSGPAKVVWKIDEFNFAKDLLGKSKSEFNDILSKYPNIDSAQLVLSPFWVRSIPSKLKDIKVIVNYPK